MTNPWFKYYPTDWRADPRLRMCSLAARGLWIELLGYMHEAEPYGHLTINGANPTDVEIASLVGRPLAEVRRALSELASRQVFSLDSNSGAMFSRRMVRDNAKALKDKENGGRGGNPKLKGGNNGGVNPDDKAQKPEARYQIPESRKKESRAVALVDDWPVDYREWFWSRYPNKVGKPRALAKLDGCRRRGVAFDAIMSGLDRYIANKPPDRAWLNPETFLNQERWTDQPAAPVANGRGPPGNSFASLHLDLQNAHGGYHDSPGLGEFDAPGFDLDIKPNSGG